jgi:hypothetical protein
MKKLKQNCRFLMLVALLMLGRSAQSQVTLSQVSVTPASGPYANGSIVTIRYALTFSVSAGQYAEFGLSYNSSLLSFNPATSNLALNNTLFSLTSSSAGNVTYGTSVFTSGISSSTVFDVSFTVIGGSCAPITAEVNALATLRNDASGAIVQSAPSVLTQVLVENNDLGPYVQISQREGSTCSRVLYEITSFGKDLNTGSGNSVLTLELPAGVTLVQASSVYQVFNSAGNLIAPVTSVGSGPTTYSWSRSGQSTQDLQSHYVLVEFSSGFACPDSIRVGFTTHSCLNVVATASGALNAECCEGSAGFSKTLQKYPLRYFPAPDNCRSHTYVIEYTNLTSTPLSVLKMFDDFENIDVNVADEILVSRIDAKLSRVFPWLGTATFAYQSVTTLSTGGTVSPTGVLSSAATAPTVLYNGSSFPYPDNWKLVNQGGMTFPPMSKLRITIKHKLNTPPSTPVTPRTHEYENTAALTTQQQGGNVQTTSVTMKSRPEVHAPLLSIEKSVRNPPGTGIWNGVAVTAAPNETVQFRIVITNYGMATASNIVFTDIAATANSNYYLLNPGSFTLTCNVASAYTATQLTAMKNAMRNVVLGNTASYVMPTIAAAPCLSNLQLVLTYTMTVQNQNIVTCPSSYLNTATLQLAVDSFIADKAAVNIDLFKNIMYKLEASCKLTGPWTAGLVNGVAGYPMYYRATIVNGNNYPLAGVKMMVQLPNGAGTGVTTTMHPASLPEVTLISSNPGSPPGTGLFPVSLPIGVATGMAVSDWLNATTFVPAGNEALYVPVPTIAASNTYTMTYQVTVPVNIPGSIYKTAMGISLGGNTPCPILRKAPDVDLKIATSSNCQSLAACDLIQFEKEVQNVGNNTFKVSINNILDLYPGYDIHRIDVVVHQPYKNCMVTTGGYLKPMLPFTIGAISSSYAPFSFAQPTTGQRWYEVTNSGTITFGNLSFLVNILPPYSNVICPLTFPVNLVFKDTVQKCTVCERTVYLTPSDWSLLIQEKLLTGNDDPVNSALNEERRMLNTTSLGSEIEAWYADFKSKGGIQKMLVGHFNDAVSLMQLARKLIQEKGTLEADDLVLLEKTMRMVDREIAPAPPGLVDRSLRLLKASSGKTWSVLMEDLRKMK